MITINRNYSTIEQSGIHAPVPHCEGFYLPWGRG